MIRIRFKGLACASQPGQSPGTREAAFSLQRARPGAARRVYVTVALSQLTRVCQSLSWRKRTPPAPDAPVSLMVTQAQRDIRPRRQDPLPWPSAPATASKTSLTNSSTSSPRRITSAIPRIGVAIQRSAFTDANGVAVFADVPSGMYEINAKLLGFKDATSTVTFVNRKMMDVLITLQIALSRSSNPDELQEMISRGAGAIAPQGTPQQAISASRPSRPA